MTTCNAPVQLIQDSFQPEKASERHSFEPECGLPAPAMRTPHDQATMTGPHDLTRQQLLLARSGVCSLQTASDGAQHTLPTLSTTVHYTACAPPV